MNAESLGKWNVVVALAVPEAGRKKLDAAVQGLRRQIGGPGVKEVKLIDIPEERYFQFLVEVEKTQAVAFSTVTDAGLNSLERVAEHQQLQVSAVLRDVDKMKFEEGRLAVELIASQLKSLSPQLYVQLVCQINLMYDVVSRSITYFAQRNPSTLRQFRWRIDQKNSSKPDFEEAFEKLSPPLLQSRSMEEPMDMVRGFDYRYMAQYEFPGGKPPEYLKRDHGIEVEDGFDIQKLVRGDMKFLDSKRSNGIQAADLIASGIRRCLRQEFDNNRQAACNLGSLMLQAVHNGPPINLVTLGASSDLPPETASVIKTFSASSRSMLK